jgi:hypothetical protein
VFSPIFPLHISASYSKTTTSGTAQMFISTNEATASNPFGLRFQVFGGASLAARYATLQTTDYNSADGGNIVLQPGGGNVGIGTTNPATLLQVVGTGPGAVGTISIRGTSGHLGYQDSAGTFKGWVGYFNGATHGTDVDLNIKTGYKEASNIRFSVNGDTGEVVRFASSGNVGIGNSSPLQALGRTLTVEGTGIFQANISGGNYNENLRLNRSGNGYSSIAMGGSYNSVSGTATGQWTLVAAPVGLGYKFYLEYAGTETFTVTTSGQIRQNNVGIVQVVPIGPTATNISYSGTINGQYAVGSTSIPSAARWVFADVFVTANISDHQNFMLTRSNFGAQKTWVDTRGNNPANEFGNLTQDDVTFITYFGESDGFTSNYGLWKAGLLIPSSGRNIWINNYGNSGSSGYLYFIVRGYSL